MMFLILSLQPISLVFFIIGVYYYSMNFTVDYAFIRLVYIIWPLLLIYPFGLTKLAGHYYPVETKKAVAHLQNIEKNSFSYQEKKNLTDLIENSAFSKIEKDYAFVHKKETINNPVEYSVYLKNANDEYDFIHKELCDPKKYPEEKYPKIHGKCYEMLVTKFVKVNKSK